MASEFGLMMAAFSPSCIAMVKKAALMISRWGRPKEILDTPRMVFPPSSSRTLRRVSKVVSAPLLSELTVRHKASTRISSWAMPYQAAVSQIFLATWIRPLAVSGIPSSSRARATTTPPYFFTRGNTALMDSSFPLTELIRALPLQTRRARSMASISEVSICRGRSRMP